MVKMFDQKQLEITTITHKVCTNSTDDCSFKCGWNLHVWNDFFLLNQISEHLKEICNEWRNCTACKLFFPDAKILSRHQTCAHSTEKDWSESYRCEYCPGMGSLIT